jgi:hypothetical protein
MSVRPITDTLRLLDGGAFLDRCSDDLAALVKAVEATGKTGKLSITLDLKTLGNGAISITPKVNAALPEPKPDTTLLWATVEGNLTLDNPKQQRLDLRAVDMTTGELRNAS